MNKIARRHGAENAAEQESPSTPSRSTLPKVAFWPNSVPLNAEAVRAVRHGQKKERVLFSVPEILPPF
jgi:hypothetical protein